MSGRHVKMSGDMLRCLGDMLRCPGDIWAFFLGKMSEGHVQMSGGHVK